MPTDTNPISNTPPVALPVVLCPDCETAQQVPPLPAHQTASCQVCGTELTRGDGNNEPMLLALSLSALALYFPATFMPLMIVTVNGDERGNTLFDGPIWLAQQNFHSLAVVVFLFTLLAPLLWLTGLSFVLGCIVSDHRPSYLGRILRWTEMARIWAMPEVFLVGGLVAYSRVKALETTDIATGGWIFLFYSAFVLAIEALKDRHKLWEAIMPGTLDHALIIDRAGRVARINREGADVEEIAPEDAFTCHACHMPLVVDPRVTAIRCPRCSAYTERRKPGSMHRCLALVIASLLLYIPANVLPIMTVVEFGSIDRNTIISGVFELYQYGLWPLALIVFTASILVPLLKLVGLSLCMIAAWPRTGRSHTIRTRSQHARLYRIVEHIGRWSNIDVFMISMLVALIEFGNLARVDVEPGAVAFAAVVILTMFASRAFDPRLMWDAVAHQEAVEKEDEHEELGRISGARTYREHMLDAQP